MNPKLTAKAGKTRQQLDRNSAFSLALRQDELDRNYISRMERGAKTTKPAFRGTFSKRHFLDLGDIAAESDAAGPHDVATGRKLERGRAICSKLLKQGRLVHNVAKTFPLAESVAAKEAVESGKAPRQHGADD